VAISVVAVALPATVPRTECAGYQGPLVRKFRLGTPLAPRETPFRANWTIPLFSVTHVNFSDTLFPMFGKFLKFLIALALMPLVASEGWTLLDFVRTVGLDGQLPGVLFYSFLGGFAFWLLVFFLLPRTMWLYVYGHELTHALAAMLAGGKVSSFKVTSQGGHVMTDRINWWIALSPYFVPIYALLWIGLWVTVDFYYPLKEWQPALFFGLGLFWCFHLTFTVSMIHMRQTDLTGQGIIFSLVIIAFFNLAIVLVPLSFLTHDVKKSGTLFLAHTRQCYVFTGQQFVHGATWLQHELNQRRAP